MNPQARVTSPRAQRTVGIFINQCRMEAAARTPQATETVHKLLADHRHYRRDSRQEVPSPVCAPGYREEQVLNEEFTASMRKHRRPCQQKRGQIEHGPPAPAGYASEVLADRAESWAR